MRIRTALATSLTVVVAAGSLSPALAAPKSKPKPVTKSYTATAFPPDPSHAVVPGTAVCDTTSPAAQHNEPFTVPFVGKLTVDLTGFQGDWDLALYSDGKLLAQSAQDLTADPQTPEKISVKLKKVGQKLQIRACNFAGSPTANVKYVHTPA